MQKLIIATRASDLALWQAYHIKDRLNKAYPEMTVELKKITSKGDRVLDKPLALIGGKGHFTKELEDEMLLGNAHMAVHSLKDVPTFIPDGLELVAITKRQDQSDVFLSHKYKSLEELPKGAVVGTTSLRRRMQLLSKRDDLKLKDLRGNVNTRLAKLKRGDYDGIILAYIGLSRLDLLKDIPFVQKLPLEFMIPPMGQAALGIEIVQNNKELRQIALSLNDKPTFLCTKLERDFVRHIGAGCSAPVATNAIIKDDTISITAMIGFANGTNILKHTLSAKLDDCDMLGEDLAKLLITRGAIELLEDAQKDAFKDQSIQRL